ncbi:transcriptional regulator with XRE-family HTH domain [Catenulispora sp. GAS73]|uniref:NB-ARC domain-containing protein n=1 Tax=Catenulispora sp. GAS73 TaxID=3156269 RepID=UPI003510EF5F
MPTNWAPLPAGLSDPARRLAEELRAMKDASGLTLAQLGTKTHYARSSWERWLNGKRLVTRSAALSLAALVGGEPAWLLEQLELAAADPQGFDGAGAPPPTVRAPHPAGTAFAPIAQLPADIADVTGREPETAQLVEVLTRGGDGPGRLPVAVVTGGGGLGKTTLAVHAAHQAAAWFPDGQLYVDLRGADPAPREASDVLASFLRALAVPEHDIPQAVDDRAARYRTVLTGRKALIVLDNAHDAAQIRPLIPAAPGCAVLVTSRRRLSGVAGAHRLDLDLLAAPDALALIESVIGPERAAAELGAVAAIVECCAGLPLALRIAGARLADRSTGPSPRSRPACLTGAGGWTSCPCPIWRSVPASTPATPHCLSRIRLRQASRCRSGARVPDCRVGPGRRFRRR